MFCRPVSILVIGKCAVTSTDGWRIQFMRRPWYSMSRRCIFDQPRNAAPPIPFAYVPRHELQTPGCLSDTLILRSKWPVSGVAKTKAQPVGGPFRGRR
jgi:hypothetical protein